MSLIERWGVAATDRRFRLWYEEPVITQSETLSERERQENLLLMKGNGKDVPMPIWAPCEERAKKQQKKRNRRHAREARIQRLRAINTRITISATNVPLGTSFSSSAPFSYPYGHDVHVHILFPPSFSFFFLSFILVKYSMSLSFSLRSIFPILLYFSSLSLFFFPIPALIFLFSRA